MEDGGQRLAASGKPTLGKNIIAKDSLHLSFDLMSGLSSADSSICGHELGDEYVSGSVNHPSNINFHGFWQGVRA
ncbi:hypothetical protein MKZ38_006917 [Zalerion maritima]|uniref:Uncharacterized protein n=1 Tax=Zalerion maritima TaxID=339359 RepID=A0AAD5RV41_9PEZI|nr:hypothetical protein MKZ38_006917 [Zalerion maritima]